MTRNQCIPSKLWLCSDQSETHSNIVLELYMVDKGHCHQISIAQTELQLKRAASTIVGATNRETCRLLSAKDEYKWHLSFHIRSIAGQLFGFAANHQILLEHHSVPPIHVTFFFNFYNFLSIEIFVINTDLLPLQRFQCIILSIRRQ